MRAQFVEVPANFGKRRFVELSQFVGSRYFSHLLRLLSHRLGV